METRGEEAIRLTHKNMIVWDRISLEFFQFVIQLQETKQIVLNLANSNVYADNKKHPNYPITHRFGDHDTPHWCPMIIQIKDTF